VTAILQRPCRWVEDALQFAAAEESKVDAIVTRNKKHFRQRDIPVWSPEEAVEAIQRP